MVLSLLSTKKGKCHHHTSFPYEELHVKEQYHFWLYADTCTSFWSDLKFCQAVSKHTQGIFLSCQELSNRLNTVQSKMKNYKLFWSFLNICNVSFKNGKGINVILNQKREFMKYFSLISLISLSFGHTHRHTIQPFPLKTFCVFFSSHNPPIIQSHSSKKFCRCKVVTY